MAYKNLLGKISSNLPQVRSGALVTTFSETAPLFYNFKLINYGFYKRQNY